MERWQSEINKHACLYAYAYMWCARGARSTMHASCPLILYSQYIHPRTHRPVVAARMHSHSSTSRPEPPVVGALKLRAEGFGRGKDEHRRLLQRRQHGGERLAQHAQEWRGVHSGGAAFLGQHQRPHLRRRGRPDHCNVPCGVQQHGSSVLCSRPTTRASARHLSRMRSSWQQRRWWRPRPGATFRSRWHR